MLNAKELRWLSLHRCAHNHTLAEHYACFKRGNVNKERVGFIDIEAEDLKADYGIMFSYVIKPLDQSKLYFDILNRKDVKNRDRHRATEDKRILLHLIKDMRNFDRLVGHYSSRYDLLLSALAPLSAGWTSQNTAYMSNRTTG